VLVGAGLFSAVMLAIALTAGLLLAAAFVVTRRLWLVIGIHFAWNFTQGGIFGVAVSGHEVDGLLRSELSGPELIAGGDFGPEASIFAVGLCVPVAVYLLVLGHRRGRFIRPMWKRRTTVQSS
jgi:membrane protease YdiL (CAAX protease family)